MSKKRIAVLVSGRGSNLKSIFNHINTGKLDASVDLVISNKSTAGAFDLAREQDVETFHLSALHYESKADYNEAFLNALQTANIDLVVLAGFLKMIPKNVITAFQHRIINIHPALLPSFGGKGLYGHFVHEAVLEYGAKLSGATVHFVETGYDTGPPIIQQSVPVLDNDTPDTLAARVLEVEHEILPKAIQYFCKNKIEISGRKVRIKS